MSTSCELFLDDIEDILGPTISKKSKDNEDNQHQLSHDDLNREGNKAYMLPKQLKKQHKRLRQQQDEEKQAQEEEEDEYKPSLNSNVPGMAAIYIKTWGCTHNNSDSEYMAGQLASYGYSVVDDPETAHLWLLNSCTVKNPAEDHFKNYVEQARRKNKFLVVAGCVPQGAPKADYIRGLSVIGVQQIDRIVEVVEETLKGNSVRLLQQKKSAGKRLGGAKLSLPKIRKNPLVEIVAINTGCLNECTYCKTKHARGELGSYAPEEIVARLKQSFDEGCVEVWLTSEDTGAYGRDIGTNIVELMWQIVEHIPEGCMLRIGMTNPPYILEHIEQMALILQHPRVYSFLHIPVQSGSDAVLADMKREYSSDDFKIIVDYLREKVPGINIATDFICGFPTETEQDFEQSMELVKQYKFGTLFINQFFLRPGTPAQRMRQIPSQERKRRTKLMSDFFHSYTTYEHKLGTQFEILVTEHSSDSEYFVGHNKFYEQVLVPKLEHIMGKVCLVEIVKCDKFSMTGKVLSVNNSIAYRPIAQLQKHVTKRMVNEDECCGDGAYCCNTSSKNSDDCCSTKNSDSNCCSSSQVVKNNSSLFSFVNMPHFKEYALVSLLAFGATILVSRIAFRK